jgi:hypothetical protein
MRHLALTLYGNDLDYAAFQPHAMTNFSAWGL